MEALAGEKKRVVILGGGFGGAYAVQAFGKKLAAAGGEVVLIDRSNYLLFYPLLVEAGVGSIEARHVVVPVRKFMHHGDFRMAEVLAVDLKNQTVTYRVQGCGKSELVHYDHLVLGLGSITKTPQIPGLREYGFEMKSLMDAIGLRDRGIRLLELANTISDSQKRRELLTCVVVGGNYTGVEFAGEYHAFLHEAAKSYPNVRSQDIRMVLVEYSDRILPATTVGLGDWCSKTLKARGVEIQVRTTLKEVGPDYAITTGGERIRTRTTLWAAGIAPNPLLAQIEGLPLNKFGYIECEPDLHVKGHSNVWAIGDGATVMSPSGRPYPPTAQTASRQGPRVAKNILAVLSGESTKHFHYKELGSFAAIGRKQAAANILGFDVTGFLGWLAYRGTYLAKMPSLGMKLRLLADWTTEIVFKNEPVQLGVHRLTNHLGDPATECQPEFETTGEDRPNVYAN